MPSSTISQPLYRPMRQIRQTRAFYRFLFRGLRLPFWMADTITKGMKYVWNPSQGRLREEFAARLGCGGEAERLKRDGYIVFDPDRFAVIDEVLTTCRAVVDERAPTASMGIEGKDFLLTVAKDAEFAKWPHVFKFVTSRDLIDIASAYFGRVPVLSGASLWWTPPNETFKQSQMFHCDREDNATLKMFFNIEDVTREKGPFTLLPGDASDRAKTRLRYHKRKSSRVTDDELAAAADFDGLVQFTGVRAGGACVDTSRCFHYGSRGNIEPRSVLMLRFSDYLVPFADIPDWSKALDLCPIELDDYQKLLLGFRAG